MKIILSVDSLKPPITGIGNYTLHLSDGLADHAKISSVLYFSRSLTIPAERRRVFKALIPARLRRAMRRIPYAYGARDKMSELLLRKSAPDGDYLYHEPAYIALPYRGPSVVTVSDLSHMRFPQFHLPETVRRLERHLPRSIANAAQVITHSQLIRNEVVSMLGVSPERISLVRLGVGKDFHPRTEAELRPVLETYGIAGVPYLLSVCTLEPRKNLDGLLLAFSNLPASVRRTHPLVLAGHRGWLTQPLEKLMRPLQQRGELLWLGYVPAEDLPPLYAGAYGFAYPSHYEGFGLPPLEAMASGVPVVTSKASAMSEIVDGCAALVNPQDIDDITSGLQRLLYDHDFRAQAKARGPLLAERYTWEHCVDQTIAAYHAALHGTNQDATAAPQSQPA